MNEFQFAIHLPQLIRLRAMGRVYHHDYGFEYPFHQRCPLVGKDLQIRHHLFPAIVQYCHQLQ